MATQIVPLVVTSDYCEDISNYGAFTGVAADTERVYAIGSDTLPDVHTSVAPVVTTADPNNGGTCVTYMTGVVPASISAFATFTATTGVISWTKFDDENEYGFHEIAVSAETAFAASFGAATNLAVYMSKPACEAPLFKVTSVPAVKSTMIDMNELDITQFVHAVPESNCLLRYVTTFAAVSTITDTAAMEAATTIENSLNNQNVVITFPDNKLRDGVHVFSTKAYSLMNVALYEGISESAFAVNTYTLTKWQQDCETAGIALVTVASVLDSAPAFY